MATQRRQLIVQDITNFSGSGSSISLSNNLIINMTNSSTAVNNFVSNYIPAYSKILFATIDPDFKLGYTTINGNSYEIQKAFTYATHKKDSDGDTLTSWEYIGSGGWSGTGITVHDSNRDKWLNTGLRNTITLDNFTSYKNYSYATYMNSENASSGKIKSATTKGSSYSYKNCQYRLRFSTGPVGRLEIDDGKMIYVIDLPRISITSEGGDPNYINLGTTFQYMGKNEDFPVEPKSTDTSKVRFKWWSDNPNNTTAKRTFKQSENAVKGYETTYTAVFANVYNATLKGGRPISEYEDIGGGVYYHKISGRYCPASAINYSYNLTFDDHQTITSYQPQGLQTPGGWKFKGWDVYNPSGEVTNCYELGKTLIPNSTQRNLEFVAHWEREEFDITYDFNLASSKDSTIINESELNYLTKYKIGTQPQYLTPTPLRQHYTLKEWHDMSHSSNFPTEVVPMSQDHFGDCQYVATWDKNIYTITYTKPANAAFDTSSQIVQNYTYEDSDYKYYTISLPGISMIGYTFNGWVDTATSKTVSSFSSSDGVNKIFNARFSPNKQIVSCEISSNGIDTGDNLSDIGQIKIILKDGSVYYNTISNIDYDTEISKIEFLLNDSYKKKYEFVSWQSNKINDIEKFNTILENKTVGLDFDNVYTVILKKIEYKINISYRTLKRDGTFSYETSVGELIKLNLNEKLYFNDTQTMTMVPNKGYIFNGWDDEKKMTYEITFDQNSLSNSIDCTAHFTEIDLTEYDLSMIDPETKLTLDEIIASEIIAKKLQKYNYTEAPLNKIGEYSFSNNTNLEWFCVQTNQIDNLAFQNCKKLNLAMIIPNSDKSSLNGNAFNGCDNLNLIVLKNNTRFMSLKNTLPALFERGLGRIYVPQDKLRDYETDNYWNPYYQKGIILPIESSTYKDN